MDKGSVREKHRLKRQRHSVKKIFLISIVAFLFSGSTGAQQPSFFSATRDRIVFVDLDRVFSEFYKTQLAKSRIEVQQGDIDIEKQVMVDAMTVIDSEVDELKKEARDTTLSEEIRDSKRILYEERLLELREAQKEIEEFTARRQRQLQLQVTRMSQKIMDEIRHTVVEYARVNGLMAVIDSSPRSSAANLFVYTHKDIDITEDVLSAMNRKRPELIDGDRLLDEETHPENELKKSSEES